MLAVYDKMRLDVGGVPLVACFERADGAGSLLVVW